MDNSPHDKLGQEHLQVQALSKFGDRWRWVVSTTLRPFTPGQRPVTCCKAGWISHEVGLDGTVNLDGTGIRFPECPVYCRQEQRFFFLSLTSTHRHIVWIPRAFSPKGRRSAFEAHLLPCAEAKSEWSYASTILCAFRSGTWTLPLPILSKVLYYQQRKKCKRRLKPGNSCYLVVQHL